MQEDAKIIQNILSGDINQYKILVERYSKKLLALTTRMTGYSSEGEDLAQETFVRAFQNLHRYDPQLKFSTWLFKIATNLTLDHLKKRREYPYETEILERHPESNPDNDPELSYFMDEDKRLVLKAVDKLPHEFRIVVELYYIQEMSYKDISNVLNINISKVKNRLFKGRRLLKDWFVDQEFGKGDGIHEM